MKTLTATLVAEIRQHSRSGTVTAAALATEYGVSRATISRAAWGLSALSLTIFGEGSNQQRRLGYLFRPCPLGRPATVEVPSRTSGRIWTETYGFDFGP